MGFWLILLLLVIGLFLYRKISQPLLYWKKRNVPHDAPLPFVGNLLQSMLNKKSSNEIMTDLYNKYSNQRYFGLFSFGSPTLIIRDVELAKQICIKDFDDFADHRALIPKGIDRFWDKLIFARKGSDWQEHRKIASAAFTLSKLRAMFPNFSKSIQRLITSVATNNKMVTGDVRPLVMRLANDITLDYFLGIECDSFKYPDNEFLKMATSTYALPKIKMFMLFCSGFNCTLARIFKIKFFHDTGRSYYRKLIKDTLEYRQKNKLVRIDMLQLHYEDYLKHMGENNENSAELQDEIVALLMGMYAGNFDSFTTSFCNFMYELALQPEVQEKLIQEIDETWRNCEGNLTYAILMQMKYLDMVYQELTRLRGLATSVDRIVTKPYTIQPKLPHEQPLHLMPGQDIFVPIYCYLRDEKYFPDPLKFDPERFSDENKANIDSSAFIPFGSGPRKCIAFPLVNLETKLILFHLLLRFRFVPTEKTALSFVESKRHGILSSEHGYWMGLEPRQDIDHSYLN